MHTLSWTGPPVRMLAGFILCLGLLVVPALPVGAYADPGGTFQIAVADGWSPQQPSDSGIVAEWATVDSAYLLIGDYAITPGMSSTDFYVAAMQGIPDRPGYRLISTSYVTSNGANQPLIDYVITGNAGQPVRYQQVFIANGVDGWALTLGGANAVVGKYATGFAEMVQTFSTASPQAVGVTPPPVRPAQEKPLAGHYDCLSTDNHTPLQGFALGADGTYALDRGSGGTYTYDGGTSTISFTSGPYADIPWYGTYAATEFALRKGVPTITLGPLNGPTTARCHNLL